MQGLALARAYFDAYGAPMIERQFAAYKSSMAAGLVGEGSECFGYDDAFSQDHDFGPGFCIWLPQTVYAEIGAELERAYAALPQEYLGYRRLETAQAGKRVGFGLDEEVLLPLVLMNLREIGHDLRRQELIVFCFEVKGSHSSSSFAF